MKNDIPNGILRTQQEGFANRLKFAHFPYLAEAILARRSVDSSIRVLDVGCGSGNLGVFFGEQSECRLFGLDLFPEQLLQARERGIYEGLCQVNLVDGFPFASESFDIIVCNEVLMYLPNSAETLSEFHRVLVPNGKLFVYNPIAKLPGLCLTVKKFTRRIYREPKTIALDVRSNWREAERACRITYYSFQSLIEQIRLAQFQINTVTGFRIFRNRIRFMRHIENYSWYRRLILFLAARYPHLASDILVVGHKKLPSISPPASSV